jgi:hypothetical protein
MRTTGIVFTAVGIAAVATGGIVLGFGVAEQGDYKKDAGVVLDDMSKAQWHEDHCKDPDQGRVKGTYTQDSQGMVKVTDNPGHFTSACSGYQKTWIGGVMMGGGAVLAIAGIVMAKYAGGSEEQPAQVSGRRKHHDAFAITPVVSPSGAGATFRMEW